MNNADKIIKRCRALALAGMIGITSLGSSLPAFAAGPGDDSSRVSEISTGGPGDPGNTNSSNSTTNTGNSNNSNSNNNTNNSNNTNNTNNSNTSSNNTTTNTNAWKKVNGTYQMSDGSATRMCSIVVLMFPDGRERSTGARWQRMIFHLLCWEPVPREQ